MATIWQYAWITGAIGLVGGIFLPMLLMPGANQGPMLGIFITGPGGLLLGAIAGLVCVIYRRFRAPSDQSAPQGGTGEENG